MIARAIADSDEEASDDDSPNGDGIGEKSNTDTPLSAFAAASTKSTGSTGQYSQITHVARRQSY